MGDESSSIESLQQEVARLRQRETRWRSMIENSPDHVMLLDLEARILSINRTVPDLTVDEVLGRSCLDFTPPEFQRIAAECFRRVIDNRSIETYQTEYETRDGATHHFDVRVAPIIEAGVVSALISTSCEITSRGQADRALEESERTHRALFDRSPVSLWREDFSEVVERMQELRAQGVQDLRSYLAENPEELSQMAGRVQILDVNDRTLEMFHARSKEQLLEGLQTLFDETSLQVFGRELIALWKGESTFESAASVRTLAGNSIEVLLRLVLETKDHESDPTIVIVSMMDITERKRAADQRLRLETKLLRAQKLESLSELAGGIAHDFNNLLVGILGNTELALMDMAPEAPGRSNLREVEAAARRAADLARQMLAFSGRGRFAIGRLNLRSQIEAMKHLLEAAISGEVTIDFEFATEVPAVEADPEQLRQLIMSLTVNAGEAIGDGGGLISIRTGAMQCDRSVLVEAHLGEDLPEGVYAYFEVSDTGCGMDEETQPRIFDPFFSTKFIGRGLGLAAALGIVRGHSGAIQVLSEAGKGSSFRVFLPASRIPETADDIHSGAPAHESLEGKTVMFVDDEETVRTVGQRMLERFGVEVVTASDGEQALDLFEQDPGRFDCVVLDLTMPRLDGEATLRAMKRIRGDVSVVLSSGYSEDDLFERFGDENLAGFLQKPYLATELHRVVLAALQEQ